MTRPLLARRPALLPVLRLPAGQVIAWQLTAAAAATACMAAGPARWGLAAAAAAGTALTMVRWRHRWGYQWVRAAWGFGRARRDAGRRSSALPQIDVAAVQVQGGLEAAVVRDGDGFAVILSAGPPPGGRPMAGLPLSALASLLEPGDPLVSGVQVVIQADCAGSDLESGPAVAYQNLGYEGTPRSQTLWIVLRHDPGASSSAGSAPGGPAEVRACLARSLAARAQHATEWLSGHGLRAELLPADAARAVLAEAADVRGPAPGGAPAQHWRYWRGATAQHITYWLRRWPADGLLALQHRLAGTPVESVTTAVTLTCARSGRVAVSGVFRVAFDPVIEPRSLARCILRGAASCGAELLPLDGTHVAGVLATLPLGRELGRPGRWPGAARRPGTGLLEGTIPVMTGGVVIGADAEGDLVTIPLFGAIQGARVCIAGHPALPRLLALRALGAGARVQVVTGRPAGWLRLCGLAGLPAGRMTVTQPGSPPPAGSRAAPWLVIDDTGGPAAARGGAWQATVIVALEVPAAPAVLAGLDAVLFQRATAAAAAAAATAFRLPGGGTPDVAGVPGDCLAVASPGSVRVGRLIPDQAEQAALTESLRAG